MGRLGGKITLIRGSARGRGAAESPLVVTSRVLFLPSDESGYITGAEVAIDGGAIL